MWIASLFSFLGTAVGGLFGMKQKQAEVVSTAISTIKDVTSGDSAQAAAAAQAITSLYQFGNVLERSWRPLFMYIDMALIVARWFGWSPPYLTPVEVEHLYTFLYIGLVGYIPMRSLDKWMLGFQIGSVLKKFIEKKVL